MATASKTYTKSRSSYSQPMWPANLTSAYDYLQIDIRKFVPTAEALSVSPGNATTPTAVATGGSIIIGSFSNIQSRIKGAGQGTVLLPVPDNLNYSDSPEYAAEAMGAVGKGLVQAAKEIGQGDAGGAASAIQQMAAGGKVGKVMDIVKSLTEKTGLTLSQEGLTQGLSGKIMNPYTEQVFKGIGMRSFDFTWKLVPRSEAEQLRIKEIIKILRRNALPNFASTISGEAGGGDTLSDRWLEVPNIYNLTWRTIGGGEMTSLPRIKPCICKSVQVSYTPDNVWATHMVDRTDPHPVAYNLTLQFQETEILTGKDVDSGGY